MNLFGKPMNQIIKRRYKLADKARKGLSNTFEIIIKNVGWFDVENVFWCGTAKPRIFS